MALGRNDVGRDGTNLKVVKNLKFTISDGILSD
jgi:hypothetical protein